MEKQYICKHCGDDNYNLDGWPDGKRAIYCKSCGHRTINPQTKEGWSSRTNNFAKILSLDVETAPLRGFVWKVWREDVGPNRVQDDWFILTWAGKWLHEPDVVHSERLTGKEAKDQDDKRIMNGIWDMVNEADIVIAHNGKKFDIPKLNTRFLLNGLMRPLPYQQIDTLQILKKSFAFSSNKLDYVNGQLKIMQKIDTNFELWEKCYNGDEEALEYMENYNRTDVIALEQLYFILRPWMDSHPNVSLWTDLSGPRCSHCGSKKLAKTYGKYSTGLSQFPVYRCMDCGALPRGRKTTISKERTDNIKLAIAR